MKHQMEGLPILSSCCQICHEAAGMLYGCNIFVFDSNSYGMSSDLVVYFGAKWLRSLESCLQLVRRVVLRLGARLAFVGLVVDLLSMLEVVWRKDAGQLNVKFYRTERAREGPSIATCPIETAVHEVTLDRLLYLLGTNDSLSLRQSSIMMRQVLIARRGAEGHVVYR